MITQNDILRQLNKYGFDSFSKEPFLYEQEDTIGIYYTIKDPLYGYLNRVFLPNTLEESEQFIKNYYRYKKENKKGTIKIILSNYTDLSAVPKFIEEVQEEPEKKEPIPEKKVKPKRKMRTAYLMIGILLEKIHLQNCTYNNLQDLSKKYYETKNEWIKKKNEYLKTTDEIKPVPDLQKVSENTEDYGQTLKEELDQCDSDEEITNFIINLTEYIKNIEKDANLLKNKYLLIKTPIQIDILQKEIHFMEELIQKRKRMKSKKESLETYFKEIEEKSELQKIVSFETYVQNEQKRIDEKYEMISEMELGTIADYLMEFDNIKLNEPNLNQEDIQSEALDEPASFEQTMRSLEEEFSLLSKEQQNTIYIITSFLRELFNEKKETILTERKEEVEDVIRIINQQNNILTKIKILSKLDTSSIESLIDSLKSYGSKLQEIPDFHLKSEIHVFFQGTIQKKETPFIYASTKKSCMPIASEKSLLVTYIALLKKGTRIYFSPKELLPDISNEEQIILKDNCPIIAIDRKKNIVKNDFSDIIKIARYQIKKKEVSKIILIKEVENIKTENYQKIEIERKEDTE